MSFLIHEDQAMPWPKIQSANESLDRYGTVAFSSEYMKQWIGFGEPRFREEYGVMAFIGFDAKVNPTALCIEVWMAMVPDKYRIAAAGIIEELKSGFLYENIDSEMLDRFIKRFQDAIESKRRNREAPWG